MSREGMLIISSDGHAGALMADYRPYLEAEYQEEFDEFLVAWEREGARNFDPPALKRRLDPEFIDEWNAKLVETDRISGYAFSSRRVIEMDREGVSAEVLFPDFGIPFELHSPSVTAALGERPREERYKRAGMRAFNRWLADFVTAAPDRFVGIAAISWQQGVENAICDIHEASALGFRATVLPEFEPTMPLYHSEFEPVWSLIEELGWVVTTHAGISSTDRTPIQIQAAPHEALGIQLFLPYQNFNVHNLLTHLIWGAVLERHPSIRVALTEQGSAWVLPWLQALDYSYEGSYFRTDYQDVIRSKPSEYFRRQCFIGSSLFSRAEVAARRDIGLDNMMIGMDFPHHEGTLVGGTTNYLQATFGAERVPFDDAVSLLSSNAAKLYGFDVEKLTPIGSRIGPTPEEILTPPERDLFPRGDVHRPLGSLA